MFRGWFSNKSALRGAPANPRVKTYAAQSGFVYSYRYLGWRDDGRHWEFAFRVSASARLECGVSALLPKSDLAVWESTRQRQLNATERYAIAKMALFRAFDERAAPEELRRPALLEPGMLDEFAQALGLQP